MKQLTITIAVDVCKKDDLTGDELKLVEAAFDATTHAFAPYSHFSVGAAAMLDNGKIVIGANQENAAFPSGLCAERTCLFAAQAQYPQQGVCMLAIAAAKNGMECEEPVTPCGACRQVMLQVEARSTHPIKVILCGKDKFYRLQSARDLLPLSFATL